jgi:hypothetical protein
VAIGVLDQDGHFLYLGRRKIDPEKSEFDITLNRRPAKAGIDPLIKLIDRNPDAGGSPIGEAEPGPAGYRPDGSCYTGSDFIAFWGI